MNDAMRFEKAGAAPVQSALAAQRFPATVGCFEDAPTRATIDGLVQWVMDRYRDDLRRRPSKHVYVRKLPGEAIARIDRIRDHAAVRDAILRRFEPGSRLLPMKHTDELYLSHYNKDYGGDHGLYGRHYDGNLRFVPFCPVVRALIYLQSDATYTVVFGDSGVAKAFATYDFALLDFHRELHWVEGCYNPDDRQRIVLKCNYLVAPPRGNRLAQAMLAANTGVFYVVKAAMEYSKSPANPPQFAVGLLCNLFRVLNNVHPLVPLAFILLVLAAAGWGIHGLLT
ncbi:MAG: hypothetical protein AB7O31_13160 [Burkholderiales bacterium]